MEAILNPATDAAPISPAAFAVPSATQETPAPASQDDDIGVFLRRFDGRMHFRMERAKDRTAWDEIHGILTRAHNNNNLRSAVRHRFVDDCPHVDLVVALQVTLGFMGSNASGVHIPLAHQPPRYDACLHTLIRKAEASGDQADWQFVGNILAAASEEGRLRFGVRKHFVEGCPSEFGEISDFIGDLKIDEGQPASSGKKK